MTVVADQVCAFRWLAGDPTAGSARSSAMWSQPAGSITRSALNFDGFSAYVEAPVPASASRRRLLMSRPTVAVGRLSLERLPAPRRPDARARRWRVRLQCCDRRSRPPRFTVVTSTRAPCRSTAGALELYQLAPAGRSSTSRTIACRSCSTARRSAGRSVSGDYRPPQAAEALIGKTRHDDHPDRADPALCASCRSPSISTA